jgi:hypothetical protein
MYSFIGFCGSVDEVSALLGHNTLSLDNWFPTFRDSVVVWKRQDPVILWCGVISQKKKYIAISIDEKLMCSI